MQVIRERLELEIPVIEGQTEVGTYIREHFEARFNLSEGPLIKVAVLKIGSEDHLVLINMHHIISDGWSMQVLLRDLQHYYNQELGGPKRRLPALEVQYADYACWQRQQDFGSNLAYWSEALSGDEEGLILQ